MAPGELHKSFHVARAVDITMAVPENAGTLDELMQNAAEPGSRALKLVQWKSYRKGKRINTCHAVAVCLCCEAKGVVFPEEGTCGGYQIAMDNHTKG